MTRRQTIIQRIKDVFGTTASDDAIEYILGLSDYEGSSYPEGFPGGEKTYQDKCLKTLSHNMYSDNTPEELIHASMGICTEAGEFIDSIKKYRYYGKEYDRDNAVEELGDIMWYVAVACEVLGTTIDKVQDINIEKLKKRYEKGFSEGSAINRNSSVERELIEYMLNTNREI